MRSFSRKHTTQRAGRGQRLPLASSFLPSRPGFTLIELLVVILIMAVMVSVVVPSYGRFLQKTRFDTTRMEIVDLLAWAREQAVSRDTTATLAFDPQSETFVVTVTPPPPQADMPVALTQTQQDQDVINALAVEPRAVHLQQEYAVTDFQSG